MSRAFVKDQDDVFAEQLPERPDSGEPNYITPKGLEALKSRLQALIADKAALGDDAATMKPELERDIRWLESRITKAIVLDPKAHEDTDQIQFGATLEAVDDRGKRHKFMIVGEDEADAARGRISWLSPLAKAFIGARVGDNVTWKRPAGDLELEIDKIGYK